MSGFFKNSEVVSKSKKVRKSTALCGKCNLQKTCITPKMKPYGNNRKKILILSEAPNAFDDKAGVPLSSSTGMQLKRKMRRLFDIDVYEDCIVHHAVNCKKKDGKSPNANEVGFCRPYVLSTIEKYKPKLIILLGEQSVRSVIGGRWKKDLGTITKWRGWAIPDRDFKCWIVPTFQPSYVNREKTPPVAELVFEKDLTTAINLLDKPLPDYVYSDEEERVQILKHPEQINNYLDGLIHGDTTLTAFDYEATGRKPHKEGHQIISAAISESPFHAVAFRMFPEVKRKFKRYLECAHIKKIVHNLNYEKMWSKVILDADLNGTFMDTMNMTHVLDNRSGITSLKFQSYVNFGICDYDSHLSQYMKAERGNDFNDLLSAPIKEVLMYNGLDAMLTFRLCVTQMVNSGMVDYGIGYDPKNMTNPAKTFRRYYESIRSTS